MLFWCRDGSKERIGDPGCFPKPAQESSVYRTKVFTRCVFAREEKTRLFRSGCCEQREEIRKIAQDMREEPNVQSVRRCDIEIYLI